MSKIQKVPDHVKEGCAEDNTRGDLVSTSGALETLKNHLIHFGEGVDMEKVKEMMARHRSSRNKY